MATIGSVHRSDDGQTISVAGDVREPVADLDPALPMLLKADLQWIESVAIAHVVLDGDPFQGQLLRIQYVGERRLGDGLAGVLSHHRLRIKALEVAQAAIQE